MAERELYCNAHEKTIYMIENLEKKVNLIDNQTDEKLNKLNSTLSNEMDKLTSRFEAKIEELTKLYNNLNNTIIKIELMFSEIKKDLDKMVNEKETLKRDTRTGILFPFFMSIISALVGIIIGKLIGGSR